MYDPFSLENKTILITGASSGIGRAIAIACAKMGAKVVITGRNTERLNETFEQCWGVLHTPGETNAPIQIVADLQNENDIAALVEQTPVLDGLVNCAGFTKTIPFQFIKKEDLQAIMNVNFMAPALMSAQFVKEKKIAKGGSIVFISSISGTMCVWGGNSMYSASKGAVNSIMKNMALDLAPKGVRVNSVNPGQVETHILDAGMITQEQMDEERKRYPLKRFGKPEEVAYAVIYLLSDAAAWTTGTSIIIDGGFTLQ
jgi:NAD(P)-dependent dehydrogenase (short-subunit alcohol dehydrogenase family)